MLKLQLSPRPALTSNMIGVLILMTLSVMIFLGNILLKVHSQSSDGITASTISAETSPPPQSCCNGAQHILVGSYYTVQNGVNAKLLLNNKGDEELEVTPTIYNPQGQELQLPPVTVEAQSFRFINLADWAAIGGESYQTGSIKLLHGGEDLILGAQIYLTDEEHSLSFEEKLVEKGTFNSQRQEAVWWMPSNQAQAKVVLNNTTDAPLSVTATLAKKPHYVGDPQLFELNAHETKVLDLRQDFAAGEQFADAELIGLTLEHAALAPDALLARVLVRENARGYSNIVQFSNPNGGKSQEYQGAGFKIEDIGGEHLTPVIVARNVGTQNATVTMRVPYTRIDGTRKTIVLPQEIIEPGRLMQLNTQRIVQRVQHEQISVASLEIEYNTAPGSVIVAAQSVSANRNLVFRVPMWDPFAQRSATGGYPWRIEETSATDVYLKSIADVEEDYVAYLVWENGGMYMMGMKSIAPHQTIQIDVKRLRDEQVPDEEGRLIPQFVTSGQIKWSLRRKDNLPPDDMRSNLSLIGRSEQVDLVKGIVTSYACISCCSNSYSAAIMEGDSAYPDDTMAMDGGAMNFTAKEQQTDCYGNVLSYKIVPVSASWSSSDPSVATVSGGTITAVGAGSTDIRASWTARSYRVINNACTQVAQYVVSPTKTMNVANDIRFLNVSNTANGQIADFGGVGTPAAEVGLGAEQCTGSRTQFNITINFNLPPDAVSIFNPDARTFVTDEPSQQFQYFDFQFADVVYSPSPKGKMIVRVRRTRPMEASNSIAVVITGGRQGSGSYSGRARVRFICPN